MSLVAYVGLGVAIALVRLALKGAGDSSVERVRAAPLDPKDPRWSGSRGRQIAGAVCAECQVKLVAEADGAACSQCPGVVHRKRCAKLHKARAHGPKSSLPYR